MNKQKFNTNIVKVKSPAKFSPKPIALALSIAIGMGANISIADSSLTSATENQTQRYIVKMKEQAVSAALQQSGNSSIQAKNQLFSQIAGAVNGQVILSLPENNAMALTLDSKQKKQLSSNPAVEYIEIDPKRYLMAETTPYGITMVQANQVSDSMASNRKVCITDTGYTLNHPDLISSGVTGNDGYGNNDTGNWYNDGNGHGTHVAGTIAALGGNGQGVVGVNPSGQLGLHIVKVFNDAGNWAYGSDLVGAINQCKAAGANVISMSLGGGASSSTEQSAFNTAYSQGILSIAAAGNDGNTTMSYPASYSSVVSVAAVDSSGNKASFSQYNSQVEIAAPGVGVNSTWNNNAYKSISGTSMATPHVAGVAALIWSHFPSCSNQQVRDAMNLSAEDRGAAGRDTSYGYGIVKAKAALARLTTACGGGGNNTAPDANFSSTINGKTVAFTDTSRDDKGVTSHQWNFGDGATSTQQNPSHTYASDGAYQVNLTVADVEGLTDSFAATVNIGSNPPGGCDGISAWSSSTSYKAGDLVSYKNFKYTATWWSTGATPDVFSNVWRNDGKCAGGDTDTPPTAAFSVTKNKLAVTFSNRSTDDKGITAYLWNFGDGASATTENPVHTYAAAGTYNVSLQVTDTVGAQNTTSQSVSVSDDVQGCQGTPTWNAATVYFNGDVVAYNGKKYRANWWTQAENPEQNSGQWAVWTDLGSC